MKDKKQLLAVLLSMAMILTSCLPVHASEEKDVPITEAAPTNEYEHVDADETDVLIATIMCLNGLSQNPITKESVDNRTFIPLYDDHYNIVCYYMELEGVGWAVIHNNKLNPAPLEFCANCSADQIRREHDKDPSAKLIFDFMGEVRTEPSVDENGNISNFYAEQTAGFSQPNETYRALIDKYYDAWNSYVEESRKAGSEAVSESGFSEFLDTHMSETDVMIMAYYVLHSDDASHNFWPEDYSDRICIPLHDDAYDVVAYYISFANGGYAVVNNNSMNPAVLEFGASDNPEILAVRDSRPDKKIIYDHPFSVRIKQLDEYEARFKDHVRNGMQNYHYYNAAFEEPDADLARILYAARVSIGNRDLRDVDFNDLPEQPISEYGDLKYVSGNSWMTETLYQEDSNSSTLCSGTVTAANLAILFYRMGYSSVSAGTSLQTFYDIAAYTGVQNDWSAIAVSNYFSSVGAYDLNYSYYDSSYTASQRYAKVKEGITNNRPSVLRVPKESSYKWVLSLGWKEAANGNFIRVVSSNAASADFYVNTGNSTISKVHVYDITDFNSDAGAFVTRLYNICLLRSPDSTGFVNWLGVLYSPMYGGGTVARGFFLSEEYINRNRSDAQYLTDLYHALFGREPDLAGYMAWMNILSDNMSSHDKRFVLNGFFNSQEFTNLCASYGVSR